MYCNKTATFITNHFFFTGTILYKFILFLFVGNIGIMPVVEVTTNSQPCLQPPCKIVLGGDVIMNVKFVARTYYKIFVITYSTKITLGIYIFN